jgi:hypothetical protein
VEAHSAGRGQGSQFIVKLCLSISTRAHVPRPRPPAAIRRAGRLRCLNRRRQRRRARMLECALTLQDTTYGWPYDGVNAIDLAKAFKPEAVVLDIGCRE